jgi:hypothetical protein
MMNPSPGSCLGGSGRAGEGTVPTGAALATDAAGRRHDGELHVPFPFMPVRRAASARR